MDLPSQEVWADLPADVRLMIKLAMQMPPVSPERQKSIISRPFEAGCAGMVTLPSFISDNDKYLHLDEFEHVLVSSLQRCSVGQDQHCAHIPKETSSHFMATEMMKHFLISNKHFSCKSCTLLLFGYYCQLRAGDASHVTVKPCPYLHFFSFMTCRSLSRYCLHRSNAWRWMVDDLIAGVALQKTDPMKGTAIVYDSSRALVQHLSLFRSHHWRFIVLESCIVDKICTFVNDVMELRNSSPFKELHEKERRSRASAMFAAVIFCFFFLLKCLQHHRKFNRAGVLTQTATRNLESVAKLRFTTFSRRWPLPAGYARWRRSDRLYLDIIDRCTRSQWKLIKSKEQCCRQNCNAVVKQSRERWRICSECCVHMYCSRKCAKYDWKYGHHKSTCSAFARLRR